MLYFVFDQKTGKRKIENQDINIGVEIESESVADFSHWSPNLDHVKALQLKLSGTSNILKYDYEDGIDDPNNNNYLLRNRGLDITEREVLVNKIFDRNEETINSELEKKAKELDSFVSSESSSSDSSGTPSASAE